MPTRISNARRRLPREELDDLRGLARADGLLHQNALRLVEHLHDLRRSPFATKFAVETRVSTVEKLDQPRCKPPRNDLEFLDQTFLEPEQELVSFMQKHSRRQPLLTVPMPAKQERLLLDGLLDHWIGPI